MTWYPLDRFCKEHSCRRQDVYRWRKQGKVESRGKRGSQEYRMIDMPPEEKPHFLLLFEDGGRELVCASRDVINAVSQKLRTKIAAEGDSMSVNELTRIVRAYSTIFERGISGQISIAREVPHLPEVAIFDTSEED